MDIKLEIAQLIKIGKSLKIDDNDDKHIDLNQEYYNWVSQCRVFLSEFAGKYEEFIDINSSFIEISNKEKQTKEIYRKLMVVLYTVKKFIYMSHYK